MKPSFPRRAFTSMELMAMVVLLGVLAAISVTSLKALTARSNSEADVTTLSTVHAAVRARGAGAGRFYPTNLPELVKVPGLAITSAHSTASNVVSVGRSDDGAKAYVTIRSATACVAVVDDITTGDQTWLIDTDLSSSETDCSAAHLATVMLPDAGDSADSAVEANIA